MRPHRSDSHQKWPRPPVTTSPWIQFLLIFDREALHASAKWQLYVLSQLHSFYYFPFKLLSYLASQS